MSFYRAAPRKRVDARGFPSSTSSRDRVNGCSEVWRGRRLDAAAAPPTQRDYMDAIVRARAI